MNVLFLDDERFPDQVLKREPGMVITIVRDVKEFIDAIEDHGVNYYSRICFDYYLERGNTGPALLYMMELIDPSVISYEQLPVCTFHSADPSMQKELRTKWESFLIEHYGKYEDKI